MKKVARATARWGSDDPDTLTQTVGAFALVAVAAIVWEFADVILSCLSSISIAPVEKLRLLQEDHTSRAFLYRLALNALAVAVVAAMFRIRRLRARRRGNASLWTIAPLVAILAVTIVMSELPYRIIWQNKSERVAFEGERCYVLGESGSESLIYCPDKAPPRNRVVKNDDSTMRRTGIVESIFSPPTRVGESRLP